LIFPSRIAKWSADNKTCMSMNQNKVATNITKYLKSQMSWVVTGKVIT
jgi:hypothetical protein